jgi:hypothetical protein
MSLLDTAPLLMAIGVLGGTMNPAIALGEALPEGDARRTQVIGRAETRCGTLGDAVWLDGARIWPSRAEAKARPRIVSSLSWSPPGDAIAFVAQSAENKIELIILVIDRGAATPLAWPLPVAALPARFVTWVGPTKVAIGPTAFQPRAAVSFARVP